MGAKRYTVQIPQDTHILLKWMSGHERRTMTEILNRLIENEYDRQVSEEPDAEEIS